MMRDKNLLILVGGIILGVLGYIAFTQSREQTLGEKIDEATEEISDEIDDRTRAR